MTRARRPSFGASLPFHRLAAVAMVLAAMLPVALLGILVFGRVQQSLLLDASVRTDRAVDAATAEVGRASRELDALVRSYAEWPEFAAQVRAGDLDTIRVDVLEFLVERGTVAAGVLVAGQGSAAAGPSDVADVLTTEAGRGGVDPRLLTVDGQVYLVDDDPVRAGGTSEVGRLVLARKLDARFAADVAGFTGFAVALLGADGVVAVTTDASVTDRAVTSTAGRDGVVLAGDLITRRTPLLPGGGEELLLATPVSALQAAAGTLPTLVLVLLVFTGVIAALLALLLALVLRRRLGIVHDGLIAVADGRVPPLPAAGGGDDIARLSAGLDRLVRTLDHRETTLRRCLEATAAVPIDATHREAADQLAAATMDIFGVAWCRLVAVDGATHGWAAAPHVEGSGPGAGPGVVAVAAAPMGLGPDERLLEVGATAGGTWTDGDQASLEVMAMLAGGVLDEVDAYGRAAGRAARLDRLNRLQREFLRSISHNLRAPLATIELAASDLEDLAGTAFVRERVDAIKHEERRLARLVNQVLILSRMESGTLELTGEPVALAPLVRRVAAELRIADRVVVVDRGGGAVAFADGAAIEQIAWNLLDNAARYAPVGRISVEILVDRPEPEPTIMLAVEDEGPGVAPAERRRIFQRFVRGRAGSAGEGTGLGLSVARGLARTLGGDITCRGGAVGARFEVRLPAGLVEPGPDEVGAVRQAALREAPSHG